MALIGTAGLGIRNELRTAGGPRWPASGTMKDLGKGGEIRCPSGTRRVKQGKGTWCARRSNGRKHGPAVYRYGNGRVLAAGRYVDGRKEGVWI
jgi:hypothetical protein